MKFDNIQKQVRQQRCAGFSYAQENPAAGFRDMVTVYCDGRLLFERFCAGEAAGRVCALWAPEGADEAGRIRWGLRRVRLFRGAAGAKGADGCGCGRPCV